MGRITVTSRSAPQIGRTRADFRDHWAASATFYDLVGPRISGGITVWASAGLRYDEPPVLENCEIHMLVGHTDPRERHPNFIYGRDLRNKLTVNGVEVARGQSSTYFKPASLGDPERCGGHLSWELPERTRKTAQTLLRCIALHWARRDPEYLVHRISAVQYALCAWQSERREKMTRLYRQVLEYRRDLDHLRTVADGAHLFNLAPPPGTVPVERGPGHGFDQSSQARSG